MWVKVKFKVVHLLHWFDPVKYVKDVSHVEHTDSLLIHPNFSSKLMITWLCLFENPLFIRFQTDRKLTFDPVRTKEGGSKLRIRTFYQSRDHEFINHVTMNRSKTHFWSTFISSNWIKSEFSFSLKADQKWVFEQIESRDH